MADPRSGVDGRTSPAARLAVVGDLPPSATTYTGVLATCELLARDHEVVALGTDDPSVETAAECDGVWLIPGGPYANDDAVLEIIREARTRGVPFLGTCSGMQYVAIEFARNVLGRPAEHAQVDPSAVSPAVRQLACSLVGQTRTVTADPASLVARAHGTSFEGFHWCSYGVDPRLGSAFAQRGLRTTARASDADIEALELDGHPFFVATLFQPQMPPPTSRLPRLVGFWARAAARARRASAPS